ncbi:sulfatase [Paraglaciecola aquimarina]|uniref:Sulfatase n=1 Tax=Paraglaciecola algarum TaxID=3050085 RepID=A0ABS9D9D8_9ALTE|nr:sulfatase [Paraglaciecola sp. G1-23]MCF2949007.1 sulfatase [Paraglaciecola sp. G1-23]
MILKLLKPLLFITSLGLALPSYSNAPPNIVLIIADDLNWDDIGAYGHPNIHTPNLDNMAQNGMRFDSAYLTASSCSPSRSSILTGRYPHNTDAEQLHWDLPLSQTTFSEKLKEAGYWTGAAGKWHMGEAIKERFDMVREAYYGNGSLSGSSEWLALLDYRPKDQPFFLWLAAWDAHRPWVPGQKDLPHQHKQTDVRLPPYYPPTELYLNDFVNYYDEISRFDMNVGKVISKLEKQGIADNTLVIVIADNGRPYARDKTTLFDSGVKTPFIVHWPKGIKQKGSTTKSIVSSIDLSATFLDLANVQKPSTIEGKSFKDLFQTPNKPFRQYAFSERNWHDFEDHARTARSKRYRYVRNNYNDLPATPSGDTVYHETWDELIRLYDAGMLNMHQSRPFIAPRAKEELYDLQNDPYELYNLVDDPKHQRVLVEHRDALDNWIKESGDFIPSIRTPDDFDRLTGEKLPPRKRPRPPKIEQYGKSGKY